MIRALRSLAATFLISFLMPFLAQQAVAASAADTQNFGDLSRLGQEAYQASVEANWEEAIAKYSQIVDQGRADPTLYYNLGTAYAKAGDQGRAVLMLLRAKRLSPRNRNIRENLKILAPDLSAQMAVFPLLPVQALYEFLSLNEWAVMALIASIGAGGFFIFRLFLGERKGRMSRRMMIGFMVFATAAHTFAGVKYYEENYTSRGIVVVDEMLLRKEPRANAELLQSVLTAGTPVRVKGAGVPGWWRATPLYGEKYVVFVLSEEIEIL